MQTRLKTKGGKFLKGLYIFSMSALIINMSMLGVFFVAPGEAQAVTTYMVESYDDNSYSTVKDDFFQGETVYGKGAKGGVWTYH